MNPDDNEVSDSIIHHLTTALHLNQFTKNWLSQTLNGFLAQKANVYPINKYNHAVIRYIVDPPYDTDPNINAKIAEKSFIKSEYSFHLDSTMENLIKL